MPMKIGTARAWGRLRDFFDLKGKHELQLDEVIVAVAVVADLTEADPLADERLAQGGRQEAAAAGFVGQVQLFNPAGSGIVAELYQVSFNESSTALYQLGPVALAIATANGGQWTDRRLNGFPVCEIQGQAINAAMNLVNPVTFHVLSSTTTVVRLDAILPPGSGYMVENNQQNLQTRIGFWWRERDALPGE